MRRNIASEDNLVKEALKYSKEKTKRQLIHQ